MIASCTTVDRSRDTIPALNGRGFASLAQFQIGRCRRAHQPILLMTQGPNQPFQIGDGSNRVRLVALEDQIA